MSVSNKYQDALRACDDASQFQDGDRCGEEERVKSAGSACEPRSDDALNVDEKLAKPVDPKQRAR